MFDTSLPPLVCVQSVVTYARKMAARGKKRVAEKSSEIKSKRAKLKQNKSSQAVKSAKQVTFPAEGKEKTESCEQSNIISVPPPVSAVRY